MKVTACSSFPLVIKIRGPVPLKLKITTVRFILMPFRILNPKDMLPRTTFQNEFVLLRVNVSPIQQNKFLVLRGTLLKLPMINPVDFIWDFSLGREY